MYWAAAFRALADVTDSDPKRDAGRVGAALPLIVQCVRDDYGDESFAAAEIYRRGRRPAGVFDWSKAGDDVLTPQSLARWWDEVGDYLRRRGEAVTRDDWKPILARYGSGCFRCGRRLRIGDVVEWSALRHRVRCATGEGCRW